MTSNDLPMRLPAALACLLALLLLWECLPGRPPAPMLALPNHAIPAASDRASTAAGTWAASILARPLFRTSRRPVAAVAAASADQTPPRLSAIVITATGRNAIFINADGSASVLGAGGQDGAFQLQKITPDSVRLNGPEGALTLHPQFAASAGAPASAATAAAPARNRFDESDQ